MSNIIMNHMDSLMNHLLTRELKDIEKITNSDVLVYNGPIDESLLPLFRTIFESLIDSESKKSLLSIILTSNGGSAEAVEQMVNMIRRHYDEVDFYVPEYAYSAGTIFCMSGNRIHMDYASVLGPIDPQIKNKDGRWVPALGYLDKIQELIEKAERGNLTQAEFLILKQFDLAEIRSYEQARDLTVDLLKKWLVKYKFKNWEIRDTSKKPVTYEEKLQRAEEIARDLGDNKRWLSHGRPIGIEQLKELNLLIEDYTDKQEISDNLKNYSWMLRDYIYQNRITIYMQTREGVVMR